jgi:hypothetical protein
MVEMIGEAWQLSWRVTALCNAGKRDGMKSIWPCIYSYDLDLRTLIWTRGSVLPLSMLASQLKCPSCGSRQGTLIFHMPREPQVAAAAARR